MKQFIERIFRLCGGLFISSIGIVMTLKANIGYSPWDVFHDGIAKTLNISFGMASIAAGISIALIVFLMGEKLGLGTIMSIVLVGGALDLILWLNIIPVANSSIFGIVMLIAGLFVLAVGTGFYLDAGFGVGPRDGLMVAVARKTGVSAGICRGATEMAALFIGWLLGGTAGAGTVISSLAVGLCFQTAFKILKFKPTEVTQETLKETYIVLKNLVCVPNKSETEL